MLKSVSRCQRCRGTVDEFGAKLCNACDLFVRCGIVVGQPQATVLKHRKGECPRCDAYDLELGLD